MAKPKPKGPRIPTGSGGRNRFVGSGNMGDRSRDQQPPALGSPAGDIIIVDPFKEVWTTGLKRARGILLDESLRELRGRLGVRAYREVRDNSTVINGALLLYYLILRQVKHNIMP